MVFSFAALALASLLLALSAPRHVASAASKNTTFDTATSRINYAVMLNLGAKGSPYLQEVSNSFAYVVGRPDLQKAVRSHMVAAGQPHLQTGYIGSTIRKSVEGLCTTLDKNIIAVIPWAIVQPSMYGTNKTSGSYTILHLWFKAVSPSCLFGVEAGSVSVPTQFVAVTTDGMIIWADCPKGSKLCHFFGSFALSDTAAASLRRSLRAAPDTKAAAVAAITEADACSKCTTNLVNCGIQLVNAGVKCTLDALSLSKNTCPMNLCGNVTDILGTTIQCTECLSFKTTGTSVGGLVVSTLDSLVSAVLTDATKWISSGMDAFFGLFT